MTDKYSSKVCTVTWLLLMSVNLRTVSPHEVMVRSDGLTLCKDDKRVCVSDPTDCDRPPTSVQTQAVNMSCYYQKSQSSMTCTLSLESNGVTEPHISLIFSSKINVISCPGLFNPLAVLDITARIRSNMKGREIRSQPHTVVLYNAMKPSRPKLFVSHSTDDSVVVLWRDGSYIGCQLRFRVNNSQVWSEPPDFAPVHQDKMWVYTITDLLPSTLYTAAVACKGGIWSDWSHDVTVRTLDRVPSSSPQVCYRVEKRDSGPIVLHLMWKDLDFYEAGGRLLGYQVIYEPVKKQDPLDKSILNVTEVMAQLMVGEGNWTVTVTAFNAAGYGPAAHLSIDTQRQKQLPSVPELWVSNFSPMDKGLLFQWKIPFTPSTSSITYLVVWRQSETHPPTNHTHWVKVDGYNSSIVLRDFDPDKSYQISVFTVHQQQFGAPQSLNASLQQGALVKAVGLKVVGVNKTSVTVKWEWQKMARGPNGVKRYRLTLTETSYRQKTTPDVRLWFEEQQHTFTNLSSNTKYSVHLFADNINTMTIYVRTEFDNVPVVVTATTLLLLIITVLIIYILSRTVFKSYFFAPVSSPQGSTSGQWLMDPNKHQQMSSVRNLLDMKNFQVAQQSVMVVQPKSLLSSEELQENVLLWSLSHILSNLEYDYVSEPQLGTEKPQSHHPKQAMSCHHPDRFTSEETQVSMSLLRQTHVTNNWFSQLNLQTSHQTTAPHFVHELLAHSDSLHVSPVCQITCDAEYLVNTSFLANPDPKREDNV